MGESMLIVEPNMSGHRMRYVSRIASHAVELGIHPIVATSQLGAEHGDFSQLPEGVERRIGVLPDPAPSSLVRLQFQSLRAYQELASQIDVGRILIPYGDTVDKAAALLGVGPKSWDLLLMRSFFHHHAMGVIGAPQGAGNTARALLFRRLLGQKNVRRILTIDELLPRFVKEAGWPNPEKVLFVPDPAHAAPPADRESALRRLSLEDGVPTVLAYGALTLRKGIGDLIAAASAPGGEAYRLLFVGKQHPETKELMEGPLAQTLRQSGRLVEIDRYVDEADEADAFAVADVVWLGYIDFLGSSGVLVQAAQADRPVVGCAEGLIGWRTREFGLGPVLESRAPEAVLEAIKAAQGLRDPASAARRASFAQANTESAFLDAVFAP
jgi:hypothetical protein